MCYRSVLFACCWSASNIPINGDSVVGFNYNQFVVVRGSWIYLSYKRHTGQGHRRRLLPLHLWCKINKKRKKTVPLFTSVFPSLSVSLLSSLSFTLLLSLPTFAPSLKSDICINECLCGTQDAWIPTIHLQGHETASHALCSLRSSQLKCVAPPAGCSTHCLLACRTVLTLALFHSKFN